MRLFLFCTIAILLVVGPVDAGDKDEVVRLEAHCYLVTQPIVMPSTVPPVIVCSGMDESPDPIPNGDPPQVAAELRTALRTAHYRADTIPLFVRRILFAVQKLQALL